MDQIFDWCVNGSACWASIFGITYKQTSVLVFVILWPMITIALITVIMAQHRKIQQLLTER